MQGRRPISVEVWLCGTDHYYNHLFFQGTRGILQRWALDLLWMLLLMFLVWSGEKAVQHLSCWHDEPPLYINCSAVHRTIVTGHMGGSSVPVTFT